MLNNQQMAHDIREDLLEFAKEEILPLIDITNIDITNKRKEETDIEKRTLLVAEDNAFIIALKLFLMHDDRLQGGMNNDEIAIIMGISRARVGQILANAEKKLKHPKYSRSFKNYLNMSVTTESMSF